MKKLLMLLVSAVCVCNAYAQDVDSLQVQSEPITIDSLVIRLDKLQHDYDYMSCENQLYMLRMDLNALSQDIYIKSNEMMFDVYHGRYNRELYNMTRENYDVCSSLFDSLKNKYDTIKTYVLYKALTSNFTDEEIDVLENYLVSIKNSEAVVEHSLKYYDLVIRMYKDKR